MSLVLIKEKSCLGLGASWWNDRSFPRTNGMIMNDPIVLNKKKRLERVLKNIGTISKRMERNETGIA